MNIAVNVERSRVQAVVLDCIRQLVPTLQDHTFKQGDSLAALGMNSMERVEIIVDILAALSLRIPMTDTMSATNLDELIDLLHDRLNRR
ncbi:phosphopantetheine-binding protein [Alkalimonas collagenimarina]|uniref:Phosphopantetheine-binding protein n=1 Tax=Alkalimonas collagenimarina TaxID=400390 RepID=A0ABT9H0Y1_9GAMM|nr:phosphopantetheine-binding protein [Alkalimonas collagenimarina]MDP4536957.1 phosphopantetheine-binding protein [Alkalimonas collagenimarina]